jgi:hypothetical protein
MAGQCVSTEASKGGRLHQSVVEEVVMEVEVGGMSMDCNTKRKMRASE